MENVASPTKHGPFYLNLYQGSMEGKRHYPTQPSLFGRRQSSYGEGTDAKYYPVNILLGIQTYSNNLLGFNSLFRKLTQYCLWNTNLQIKMFIPVAQSGL